VTEKTKDYSQLSKALEAYINELSKHYSKAPTDEEG